MSLNLVELLKSQVGSQIAAQISRQFGLNEQSAKSGVDAILPTILGGLLKQVTAPGGAEKLDRTMKEGGYDGSLLDNLTNVFGGAQSAEVQKKGDDLLTSLFGDKIGMLAPVIAQLTGIKLDSFSSILATLAPLVLSFLAKQKQAMGLDAQGLSSLIAGQKDNIVAAMPPGVSTAMGLGSFDIAGAIGGAISGAAQPQANASKQAPQGGIPTSVAVGIIGIILLGVGYGAYKYIFAGIRPSGAAGNTITAMPEGFDGNAEAAHAASVDSRSDRPVDVNASSQPSPDSNGTEPAPAAEEPTPAANDNPE